MTMSPRNEKNDMDEHIHEHILSRPQVAAAEKKHRAKSKARAVARGMDKKVADRLYGSDADA